MAWTWWPGFIVLSRISVDFWSTGTHNGSWRWGDRLHCQCEYHLPFKELLPTPNVNIQGIILSDMSVRFGNSGPAGYLFWEKTTFYNIVHVTYNPGVVDQLILLCSVTRHTSIPLSRDVGGIQFIRHFKITLGQIQATWSFHSRWSQISHSSSITMGFYYFLEWPWRSVLLFHYLVRNFILVV